jgi:hypothetical protein
MNSNFDASFFIYITTIPTWNLLWTDRGEEEEEEEGGDGCELWHTTLDVEFFFNAWVLFKNYSSLTRRAYKISYRKWLIAITKGSLL